MVHPWSLCADAESVKVKTLACRREFKRGFLREFKKGQILE
jgi:hypothetical protein